MITLSKIKSVLKRIVRGENIMVITQDQEKWDAQFKKGKWDFLLKLENQGHMNRIAIMCAEYLILGKRSIFDVGCGNGALPQAFQRVGIKLNELDYLGMDISEVAVEEARRAFPEMSFAVGFADTYDPGRTFDIMIFSELMCYVDAKKVLEHYKKNLAPGGVIIISLYRSWRSWWIWYKMKKVISITSKQRISRATDGLRWDVVTAVYK